MLNLRSPILQKDQVLKPAMMLYVVEALQLEPTYEELGQTELASVLDQVAEHRRHDAADLLGMLDELTKNVLRIEDPGLFTQLYNCLLYTSPSPRD